MKFTVMFNARWIEDRNNSYTVPVETFDTEAEAIKALEAKLDEVYGKGNWNKPNGSQWCHIQSLAGQSILGRVEIEHSPEERRQNRISQIKYEISKLQRQLKQLESETV